MVELWRDAAHTPAEKGSYVSIHNFTKTKSSYMNTKFQKPVLSNHSSKAKVEVHVTLTFYNFYAVHFKLTWAESSSELFWSHFVCLSVCKFFTFSSSSPEPLGQFQPNLAESIPGWKDHSLFQVKIIVEKGKHIDKILKSFSRESLGQFQQNFAWSTLFWWAGPGIYLSTNKDHSVFKKEIVFFPLINIVV